MDKELLEKELAPFLCPTAAEDVKTIALDNVLGLTGSDDGQGFLGDKEKLLEGIVSLTEDSRTDIVEKAYKCLINLATEEKISFRILQLKKYENKCTEWLLNVLNSEYKLADLVCKLLSNLTRSEKCAFLVAKMVLANSEIGIEKIVLVLCNIVHNNHADLHYLATILENLSQDSEVRSRIMDEQQYIIQRLLPFTEFPQSTIRRQGIVGILKNCCFDTKYHDWLLSDKVDLLPRLLLPLAGPEEFDEDDTARLPEDLQYLPPEKQRDADPNIRKMLVEAILQLCATTKGRNVVKERNTYVIMREYYRWEREAYPANETTALNLIDILLCDDPPEDMPNLKEVEIPEDVQEKFHKQDEEERQQAEELRKKSEEDQMISELSEEAQR